MSPSNWNQEKRVLTVAGWISCYINKLILIRFILFWMKIIKKKVKLEGFPIILLSLSGRGSSPYTSKNNCCFYIWSCHCISLKLLNSNVFFKMSLSNDFIFFCCVIPGSAPFNILSLDNATVKLLNLSFRNFKSVLKKFCQIFFF